MAAHFCSEINDMLYLKRSEHGKMPRLRMPSQSYKKRLANSFKNWALERGDNNDSWKLYEKINGLKTNPIILIRAKGY